MRIAVTYENGNIFQHFGHTEQFKIYEVEGSEIKNSEVVDTNGSGHGALADFLKERKVDKLICGGIGGGAKAALAEAGIELFGGALMRLWRLALKENFHSIRILNVLIMNMNIMETAENMDAADTTAEIINRI